MSFSKNHYTEQSTSIKLPNRLKATIVGYADDSSVIVGNDESIVETDRVIKKFELTTGAELNRNKTCIMGLGAWKNRNVWPLAWLESRNEVTILGVYFCNDYKDTVKINWGNVISKMSVRIRLLSNRLLSLYQKAIIINTMILSKA